MTRNDSHLDLTQNYTVLIIHGPWFHNYPIILSQWTPTWLHNHRDPLGSYKEASNDFSDPTEASKSVIVRCFPAMRLLSWNSARRGRWHGKKSIRILCFAHVLIRSLLFQSDPKIIWQGWRFGRVVGWRWCFEAAQDDLMSGLAAVVGFPSSRIRISVRWERFFFLFGWVGIWDSETPKDIYRI